MIYTENSDIIKTIKAAAAMEGQNLSSLAARMGISQQNFSSLIHKKQLSFSDVSRIAAAIGYQLDFKLVPGPALFQDDQPSKPEKQ